MITGLLFIFGPILQFFIGYLIYKNPCVQFSKRLQISLKLGIILTWSYFGIEKLPKKKKF